MEDFFDNMGIWQGGLLHLSPAEAMDCCQRGALLIDVRELYMGRYKRVDVPEWIHMPCSTLNAAYRQLPIDRPLIITDTAGIRSKEACGILKGLGFQQLCNLAGGMVEWERQGWPMKLDPNEPTTDQYILSLKKESRKRRRKS